MMKALWNPRASSSVSPELGAAGRDESSLYAAYDGPVRMVVGGSVM
jgi:hypothetical protein